MIDLKVEEEQPEKSMFISNEELERVNKALREQMRAETVPKNNEIARELHQLNVTLKEILREMRKRKI